MAKISGIDIPHLKFEEQASDPAAPAAGFWRLYTKSDGLYVIDDDGATTGPMGSGGGSSSVDVAVDRVETQESTTSDSYTDLATAGPSVTVNVPASGIAVVSISAWLQNDGSGTRFAFMSFALSGDNVASASDDHRLGVTSQVANKEFGRTVVLTGLNAGTTTFTAKYRRAISDTATFQRRELSVMVGLGAA